MSVQLPFRLSFLTAKCSLGARTPYLTPGCISAHQFQRNADISPVSPVFLFIPLLFVNTEHVVFRAILCQWMRNILVCFPLCVSALPTIHIFLINAKLIKSKEFYPTCIFTCRLSNDPGHTQILSETHLRT